MTDIQPTERELEVAALVAEGFTNKEIAERLHMAVPTVSDYVTRMLVRRRLRNRTALAVWFVRTYERAGDDA
jgi:non-specific serine/threonine protein kinase